MQPRSFELITEQTGLKDFNTSSKLKVPLELITEFFNYKKTKLISQELSGFITDAYKAGYGFKILARTFNTTYTKMRGFCIKIIDDEHLRKGHSISTDITNEMRSKRLLDSKQQPWKDPDYERTSTGVSGFFTLNSGLKVFLRSTYEYVYVKWLIKNKIDFKVEYTYYRLTDGRIYRPDFFIYENDILVKIVELKGGVFRNNIDKPSLLEKQIGIPVELITDILKYCDDYNDELKEWKKYLNDSSQKVVRCGIKK